MFKITASKGFHMTFENGITVSVQWGAGNYCQNHNSQINPYITAKDWESNTAEVAIWDKYGNWITKNYNPGLNDDVIGYLTAEKVLDVLNWAKNQK